MNLTCRQAFFLLIAVNVLLILEALLNDWEPSIPGTDPLRAPETPAPRAHTNSLLISSLQNGRVIKILELIVSQTRNEFKRIARAQY